MSARIDVRGLGVRFDLDRQRRPVTPAMRRLRRGCTTTWALRGVDLQIGPGAGVAIVGANGAGKSTLLRILAGVLAPDEGSVTVTGRVGSLLAIDGGLMPALTGRENVALVGVLAGLRRERVTAEIPAIQSLSGLEDAFERPVSTYSQGMRARLGFAVMDQTGPDVLLLDEVHEAVDGDFRLWLEDQAREIRARGGIVVAAGHDHAQLSRLCDQALVMGREPHSDAMQTVPFARVLAGVA